MRGFRHSWIFGEESDFGNSRTNRGLRDAQSDFAGRYEIAANQAAAADAGARSKLHPLTVFPLVERERLDALAERQKFKEADDVKGFRPTQIKNLFRRRYIVVGAPVFYTLSSEHVFGGVMPVIAAHVAGADFCARGKIL